LKTHRARELSFVKMGDEDASELFYKAALSAANDSLIDTQSSGGGEEKAKDHMHIEEVLDTNEISELIQHCKTRNEEETELEGILERYLKGRRKTRRSFFDPWTKIEQLADSTISLKHQLGDLKEDLKKEQSKSSKLQDELQSLRDRAKEKTVCESEEYEDHDRILLELKSQLENREQECAALRIQRDFLESELNQEKTETYPARVFISTSSCIWFTRTNVPKTAKLSIEQPDSSSNRSLIILDHATLQRPF